MPSASTKPTASAPEGKPAAAPQRPEIFTLQAVQDTWLKKSTDPAADLPEEQKVLVPAGHQLPVVATRELQGDVHEVVELGHGAGQWHIFPPHYRRLQGKAPAAAPDPALALHPGEIDWRNFAALVTPNLTVGEVLQFDQRRRPSAQSSVIPRILVTADEFQAVRNAWGRPLGVTSFFRPEPINREVGGVPNSFHVQGLAMDIYPVGLPLQALYQWLIVRWTGGFGDGRDRGFIHLDRRNGGRFVPGGGVRPAVVWWY
jgi:putative chitinase